MNPPRSTGMQAAAAARRYARRAVLGAGFAWVLFAGCSDQSVQPRSRLRDVAELQISANLAGTSTSTLVVTVSAADIVPDLVFNVAATGGSVKETIALPVGTARTILVRAVNASGVTTHEGSKQVDVKSGNNPEVAIVLMPLAGNQPIDVRIGNLVVRVTPSLDMIRQGKTLALTAAVTDLNGVPIDGVKPEDIRWASLDTRVVTVTTGGVVTGQGFGDVQVVAAYGGAAGAARITVAPAGETIFAGGDIAKCTGESSDGDANTAALLDKLVAAFPGLILALGDLAYEDGKLQEFESCYAPTWGRHKDRTRPVPGNHEYQTAGAAGYFEYFRDILAPFGATATDPTKGYYSFDLGSWHVIALNSEIRPISGSAQVTWLRDVLVGNAATKQCVLAYWHRPLFNSGKHHGNEGDVRPFWDTLYAKNADLVLVAHEHLYERFALQRPNAVPDPVRGIRQFTAGGGGAELYWFQEPLKPNSEFGYFERHGILEMVLGNNVYSWRYISAPDGVVRDTGTGVCH